MNGSIGSDREGETIVTVERCKEKIKWDLADKLSEKALKEDYPAEMRRTLHLIKQHDLVGVMLARAIQNGDFDNLEGAGKPLNLYENPFEPIELRMVHRILKNAGYAPNWIELNKEIDSLKANLDKDINYFKRYTRIVYGEKRNVWAMKRYEQKKKYFYAQIRENLKRIWRILLDYNLGCPLQLGRNNIDIEDEMSRIVEDIEK